MSEEEAAAAREGHQVIPVPAMDNRPTDREGRSLSGKRARGDGDDRGHARGKRQRMEERVAGRAMGAPGPASLISEPGPTDWGSASSLLRLFAQHPARRGQGTVWGWRAER